ncbi:MAG: hypothetical protein K6E74_00585, partial [Bacilli bacterium]|nr:hypothetical protein [Bacilli bacterium]
SNTNDDSHFLYLYNPLLFSTLNYALCNYKKYEGQIEKVLDICLANNRVIANNLREMYDRKFSLSGCDINYGVTNYGNILIIDPRNYKDLPALTIEKIKEINNNAKRLEELSSKETIAQKNVTLEELLDKIVKGSNITSYFRNNDESFRYIRELLEYHNCNAECIGDKLHDFLVKKKSELDSNSNNYESDFQKLSFAITFVELYKERLNGLNKEE